VATYHFVEDARNTKYFNVKEIKSYDLNDNNVEEAIRSKYYHPINSNNKYLFFDFFWKNFKNEKNTI